MKKTLSILIILIFIGLININLTSAEVILSDIDKHWAKSDIEYLISKKIVDGYPDKTYRPNSTLQIDQFIKMIVTGLGNSDLQNGTSYWASTYIDKAIELGLIQDNEISDYREFITRKLMAKIIVNALENRESIESEDAFLYKSVFSDYLIIESEYSNYIALTYKYGLIGGYPDGMFKQNNNATRAEACTMLCRLINENRRLLVNTPILSSFMYQYNMETGFEDFIEESGKYMYTNTDKYKLENGKYLVERSTYNGTVYVDGYEPDDSYFNNLSEIINNVVKLLYGDNFYVGVDYFNNLDEYENSSNVCTISFTEGQKQYSVKNFDFKFMFYETEPLLDFETDKSLILTVRKLNLEFNDRAARIFYDTLTQGYASNEYKYRIIGSTVKIFGEDIGHDIGLYIVNEYSKKNPDDAVTFGYENIKIFGNVKVRSYIPEWSYDSIFEFTFIN